MARHGKDRTRKLSLPETGRICGSGGLPVLESPQRGKERAADGTIRIRRESKGRRGKTVTTITGVPLDEAGLRDLASTLKRLCGTGGSVKEGVIVIQGDHRDTLMAALEQKGFKAKKAGG